jgi:hypothetical protein
MTEPTPSDRLREAVEILRKHNEWRRGAVIPQESPGVIGAAIDVVCELVPSILRDQEEAAGELLVNVRECTPGTTCAKLLAALVIVRQQRDVARADAGRLAEARNEAVAILGRLREVLRRPGGFVKYETEVWSILRDADAALAAHDKAKEGRT